MKSVLENYRLRTAKAERKRRGAAAIEFAILLPVMAFLFLVALDFARIYYGALIAGNCARNGALYAAYASGGSAVNESPYTSIKEAAAADGTDISVNPVSDVASSNNNDNNTVRVTVTHRFEPITNFVSLPNSGAVPRSVVMPRIPAGPR